MELHHFFTTQRVLIVAGKGGVGKSAVAAALALASARSGLRTLLVSLHTESIEVPANEHLEHVTVTPGGALSDFLSSKGMGLLSRQLARSGIVELVATTAPGLDDLLVLGRIKAYEKDKRAEVIIVDGPAAGHAIDFVRAPAQLKRAIPTGPIGQQSDEVITMLTDPTRCKILMVTTAAMTPVMESSEVIHELQHTLGLTLLPIVVNKCERDVPVLSAQNLDTPLRNAYEYVSTRMQAQQTALSTLNDLTQSEQLRVHRYVTEGADLVESLATELAVRIQELS